jgi:hypothetical protein
MKYEKISYIIFLLLIILASLVVYYVFGKAKGKGKESMVTIGSDLTATIDIPGATYPPGGPILNNKTIGVNGYGIDPPQGYYKIDIGGNVWKMKPTIPNGYIIDPTDNKKLIVNPENAKQIYANAYYKNATDATLNAGPYEYIPVENGKLADETTPLDPSQNIANTYYRIKLFINKDDKPVFYKDGKPILTPYVRKKIPNPLPNGYIIDDKKYIIFNPDVTQYAFSTFDSGYNATSVETVYHPDVPDTKTEQINNDELGKYYTFDSAGNLTREENTDASFSPVLYYVPGAYKFGSSNYVPNYEDSVYLSRTTRLPQPSPVFNTAGMLGGFCTQFKNDKFAIEEKCGALDLNTCASTSCCTLIGGQKCVAGNENGPMNPANYTDYNLKNKDFYYYQGKCYGNCHK